MNKPQSRQSDPNVLAVLHRTGRVWRGVIARLPGNGRGSGGPKPRLLAHREFSPAEGNRMDGWLDQHDVGQVVCVLHASSVICRTCPLPDAPVEHLGPALRLQAEAHLFGIAPPHRLGMAVLEAAPGETSRSGIILAWPESSPAELPPVGREMQFAPDVASLACLLNGHRPTQPLAWVDREDGSLALAVAHAGGAVFRGLREDASDIEAWKAAVGRVLAETCLSVGHTASFSESLIALAKDRIAQMASGEAKLIAPPEVIASAKDRLENTPSEDTWWATYGVAAGIVLARAGELAPLTVLEESPAAERPSLLTTVVSALSTRKAATIAVAACIAILMFGPLLVQGARIGVLKLRYPEDTLRSEISNVNVVRNQIAMYRELELNAWSMTKILSDIVSNTPEGIELDQIQVTQQRQFDVRGRAIRHGGRSAPDVVLLMRQHLNETGIFEDVSLNLGQPDAYGHYQFRLQAKLRRPFHNFDYTGERAWDRWTYRDRIMGIRPAPGDVTVAKEPALVAAEMVENLVRGDMDDPEEELHVDAGEYDGWSDYDEPVSRPTRPDRPFTSGGQRDDVASIVTGPDFDVTSAEADIPPELTFDEVQAMSKEEVQAALPRVAEARRWARNRPEMEELRDRLQQEFDWLMDRMRSFQ